MNSLSCFGRFDEYSTKYKEEHCVTCNQARRCIYQAGIQNILFGSTIVRSKPEAAPDCFAYYYDSANRNREPSCEDMCKSFIDCVRAALSAISFSYEIARGSSEIRQIGTVNESEQKKPQPGKATSRFEVIELDGGDSE